MKNLKPSSWYTLFSLAAFSLLGAGCTTAPVSENSTATDTPATADTQTETTNGTTAQENTSSSSSTTPTSSNSDSAQTVTASGYIDGTYSATGTYASPAGKEQVPVTLTLVDGVITDVSVSVVATNPASRQWQTIFSNNFKPLVVGVNISDVQLSKVSGSSLTPKGFNDAIAQIKAQAQG